MGDAIFESLFAEAEALKKQCVVQGIGDVTIGSPKWETRQELQDKYRTLLLTNLEMSIKNGVEMDLWRYTCYNFISRMQQHIPQYKNIAGIYKIFLNASTGFFSQLLQELCETYQKKIKPMPSTRYLGLIHDRTYHKMVEDHFKYICHFCLVKLGDIARYHNDSNCAKAFYHQALQVKPLNGQPYNQLAILSATNKDDIHTLYLHIRSIATTFPFPAGQANLNNWLLKCVSDVKTSDKFNTNINFLVFRILYRTEPMTLQELCRDFLDEVMCKMRQVGPADCDMFVKICAILIFLHKQTLPKADEYQAAVYGLIVEFLSVLISEAEDDARIDNSRFLLPAVVILSHWLQKFYVRDKDELVPTSLWADLNSLVKKQVDMYEAPLMGEKNIPNLGSTATPEEEQLRSFEPLQDILKIFGPCNKKMLIDVIRVKRLKHFIKWAALNKLVTFDHDLMLNNVSLKFNDENMNSQYNSVPISPMFVPFQMVPSAPLPYPMNHAEHRPPPFPVNPEPPGPFIPPPEQQRPSFLQRFPSVMYHDMSLSLPLPRHSNDNLKAEQRDFSPQSFLPPPPNLQSPSYFPTNAQKFILPTNDDKIGQSLRNTGPPMMQQTHMPQPHMPVDQCNMYRTPNHMYTGPFMQPSRTTNNNLNPFPMHNLGGGMQMSSNGQMQNGVSKHVKDEDFAFVTSTSSNSPFSLGATPWAPTTSDPIRADLQDIWSLAPASEEITSLQQLLNGKK